MDIGKIMGDIAKGDESAFSALYRAHRHRLLGQAIGILAGDVPAAEDVVDEAFLDIWKKAGNYSGSGCPLAWMRRIVRNKAVDWLRKNADQKVDISALPEGYLNAANGDDNDPTEQISDRRWLAGMLRELSASHRETIILFYYQEMSIAEIAQEMDCPGNTVKTRLHHARRKMNQMHRQFAE